MPRNTKIHWFRDDNGEWWFHVRWWSIPLIIIGRSCTRPQRIIILPPKPGKMPPTQAVLEGGKAMVSHLFYYQLAVLAIAWLFVNVACHWGQAKPTHPTHASEAQAQALPRAQTLCRPDAKASLCVV